MRTLRVSIDYARGIVTFWRVTGSRQYSYRTGIERMFSGWLERVFDGGSYREFTRPGDRVES